MTAFHPLDCDCGQCHLHASDTCVFCRAGSPIRREKGQRDALNCANCGAEKGERDFVGLEIPHHSDEVFCDVGCLLWWLLDQFPASLQEATALLLMERKP